MNTVTVNVGPVLFRFDSKQHWIDKAKSWFQEAREKRDSFLDFVCLDAKGRICTSGRHFIRADLDGSYPIVVYIVLED